MEPWAPGRGSAGSLAVHLVVAGARSAAAIRAVMVDKLNSRGS